MFNIGTEIKLAALNAKFKIYELQHKIDSHKMAIKKRRDRQFGMIINGLKYTAEEYAHNGKINPFKAVSKVFVDYYDEKDNN